ncbi:fibronectin type III domain-containing protein [bacterium AH-315-J21]|nr:fibronectin type III domain-containing protein [bacterium AH-315-J21]
MKTNGVFEVNLRFNGRLVSPKNKFTKLVRLSRGFGFGGAVVLTLLAMSCSRTFDSQSPTDPIPASPPVPTSVALLLIDNGMIVTWTVSDTSAVNGFRIYLSDNGPNGDYVLAEFSSSMVDTLSGLVNGKAYSVRVASVSLSGFEGEKSLASSAVVGLFNMSIRNGDEFTRNTSVTISFFTPAGATAVRISEDSTFANAPWEGFAGLKNFTLDAGDGTKTVYAQLELADGSSLDRILIDSIILDTRAAISALSHSPEGMTFTSGDTVDFLLDGGESGGTASVSFGAQTLTLLDDGVSPDVTADDGIYARRFVMQGTVEVNNQQIIGNFADAAGNNALSVVDTSLISIANPPSPVIVSALALSQSAIRVEWTRSSAADFSSYRLFRSTGAAVTENDDLVTTVTSSGSTVFTDDNLDDNQTYYYRIFVYDVTNLSASSNTVSAKTLVNVAPVSVLLSGVLDTLSSVQLTWSVNSEDDFASYQVHKGASAAFALSSSIAVLNSQNISSYQDPSILVATRYYWIVVTDKQGLIAVSDSVQMSP